MNRDELRAIALKSPPEKREAVIYEGATFELLSPDITLRNIIFDKSRESNEDGTINIMKLTFWTAFYCTVVPGTRERIFEDTDLDVLRRMQSGGFLDEVAIHTFKILNTDKDPKSDTPS